MLNHLPLIFKNTWRNKRRTFLTLASIAASLCLLGFLGAIYNMFYLAAGNPGQAYRLVVRNRISLTNPMPVAYKPRIAQVEGVEDVVILQWFGGTYKDNRDPKNFFARMAVEADKLVSIYPEYKIAPAEQSAFLGDQTACVVGRKLAKAQGFDIGSRITLVGDIFPITLNLTVKAIYDSEKDNESLFFHYKYLDESLENVMKGMVSNFVVRMRNPEDASRISNEIDSLFRNSPMQTKTETERAFELSFLAFLGNVKAFLFAICSAITFTILLVSGNTMAMAVRERVKEVGILKTIGFTNGRIFSLLLGESVLISLFGGAIGLSFTVLLCGVLRSAPSTFADMTRLTTPPWLLAATLAVAVLIGLVSAFVPAWSASRRNIIDAMRVTD
ncbi:MAG: FtsX-like permease family protein [Bryobacter sp.]|nr:FtsX-like permease family protein [Bryobacter sp.]